MVDIWVKMQVYFILFPRDNLHMSLLRLHYVVIITDEHLTNRRQFSMVYTLIDHKMTSKNVQNSSGTTSRRRVVSLPSFGHFMASFYGL